MPFEFKILTIVIRISNIPDFWKKITKKKHIKTYTETVGFKY